MASFAPAFYAGRVMPCLCQTSLHKLDYLLDHTLALGVPKYHVTLIVNL